MDRQDTQDVPPGLVQRSAEQRRQIENLRDMYVSLAAHQFLVMSPERLAFMWKMYKGQLDLTVDPIIALATRQIAPVREARRVLRQQSGNVDDAIRQLLQFLELADPDDKMAPIIQDAIVHLGSPQDLAAVFADAVRTGTH